ncbi:MAG TPA: type II toxin-antitoxin system prevent-host-death family antitoxin [Gemmatimonadaceae bacterium]|jgi:prevent-host-death family protein|nr:type II toxin-antitoxin system prevent-host-death family antitoxin [Gemmatimonadaceae bacterium]
MPQHRSTKSAGTTTIPAGRLKDQVLEVVRRVAKTGDEVIITVRGVPMAKISPVMRRPGNRFVGASGQNIQIVGGASALAALTGAVDPALATPVAPLALPPGGEGGEEGPRRLIAGATGKERVAGAPTGGPRHLGNGSADERAIADAELHDEDGVLLLTDEEWLADGAPDADA